MQEKTLTGGRSYYLDIARTIAIISISLNHAVNRTYDNYFGQMEEFLESSYLSSLLKSVVTVFSHLGVPLFLMISGALLLHKRMETADDVKRFYRHNLLELFITAEIWYFIMYWFRVFAVPGVNLLKENGLGNTLLGCVKTMLFLDQSTMDSMWYMPMILCLYATIPFAAMLVKKLPMKMLSLPLLLVFLRMFMLPLVNSLLAGLGLATMSSATVREANICSMYYVYVFAGYWISEGKLSKLRTGTVAALTVLVFAVCCGYQLWLYAGPANLLVDYEHPGIVLCAMGLLELLRRGAEHLRGPSAGGDLSGQDLLRYLFPPYPHHVAADLVHGLQQLVASPEAAVSGGRVRGRQHPADRSVLRHSLLPPPDVRHQGVKCPKSHSQAPHTKGCGAFLRSAAVKVTALSPGKAKETTWHCPPFVVKYHGI